MKKLELTLENVKKIKNETTNKLTDFVCDYIINEWDDEHEDNNKNILLNIINYGCVNGSVHCLFYSSDILDFYDEYKHEINELIYKNDYDNLVDLFGIKWDKHDPLALEENNKQLLAWFGFEETITNIAFKFGIK